MTTDLLLGILGGLLVGVAAFFIYKKMQPGATSMDDVVDNALRKAFPSFIDDATKQIITVADQKLGAEKNEIKTDMENKRRNIEKMVEDVQHELKQTNLRAESVMQQIKDHEKITKELSVTTEGLRKVLTNNQLRGQFGEQVAEDLLKMSGFVKGIDFNVNTAQESVTSRPDFTIFMPDKTRINVDVKFPYANLQKATETEDSEVKKQFIKAFAKDVKDKITQVSTRDYINPAEKTVDFVILFVPNEMIFSYIYEHMNEVWQLAMEKKVVLAGPFSFTAILRMVRQAYDNFRYQKNVHQIIAHIKEFEKQFDLYTEEFNKLGTQIQTLGTTYSRVESTRTKQLTKVVDRILIEGETEPDDPLLPI